MRGLSSFVPLNERMGWRALCCPLCAAYLHNIVWFSTVLCVHALALLYWSTAGADVLYTGRRWHLMRVTCMSLMAGDDNVLVATHACCSCLTRSH
jgi:hypothetical protein